MATTTVQQGEHWKNRFISKAETISDAFDVAKAYGAHIANWILFFCLIGNILEMFSLPDPFATIFGNIVLGVQVVTLDVAGFGLVAMGSSAKERGDVKAANTASRMGATLITIMMVTAGLITVSIIFPDTKSTIDLIDKGLMLVRVLVTVLYGHIVHSLRHASATHSNRLETLEREVSDLHRQLASKQQETTQTEKRLTDTHKALTTLQAQISDERETTQAEIESLRVKLEKKAHEIAMMENDQAGTLTLRRDLNAAKMHAEDLQVQLETKDQALQNEQKMSATLRREVERLQLARATSQIQSHLSEPPVRATKNGLRATSQSHLSESEPPVRATSQSHLRTSTLRVLPGIQVDSEPLNRTPEERLQAAYEALSANSLRVSGRALAKEAHVNRTTANEWLERVKGQLSEPEDEPTGEHEAIAQSH